MRLEFLSHKFSRLVLPWALLMAGAGTLGLPDSALRVTLLAGWGLVAGCAMADYVMPQRLFLKRATSPFRTFLAMNVAALASPVVFFVPPAKLWGTTRVNVRAAAGR
jgi:drug/metabolite transporter (DMT)-like permease